MTSCCSYSKSGLPRITKQKQSWNILTSRERRYLLIRRTSHLRLASLTRSEKLTQSHDFFSIVCGQADKFDAITKSISISHDAFGLHRLRRGQDRKMNLYRVSNTALNSSKNCHSAFANVGTAPINC